MLKVYVSTKEDMPSVHPDDWFKNVFDESLMLEPFAKKIIKEISKCDVVSENLVISEILGAIAPEMIGTGCKALLMMRYAEEESRIMNIHWVGENVYPYIQEALQGKDFTIIAGYAFDYYTDEGIHKDDPILILNNNKYVYSNVELMEEIFRAKGVIQ